MRKNLVLCNTRELDRVKYKLVYLIYAKLLVHANSKGYMLSLRLTCIKLIIVILF